MAFFLTFLIFVALFIVAELLRPKPQFEDAKPAGLGDFQFPTATEGRAVPLLWGTSQIRGPNVVWYGDLRQIAIEEKVKTGLFSSDTITIGFKYEVGIQFAMCRGPGCRLRRVWVGDDEVFAGDIGNEGTFTINKPNLFGGDDLGNGGIVGDFQFFAGNDNQAISSYLALHQQTTTNSKTPAYRGTCYLAPATTSGPTYVGNSTSIKPWKFEIERFPNGLALTGGKEKIGTASNPMNVIYEIMTDTDWGLGFPATDINTSNFTTAADTLFTEGNGFSMHLERAMDAVGLIQLIEEQIDGKIYFNQTNSKWEINLARFDYDIDTVPLIDKTNLRAIKSFSRGSWEETTNIVKVQYIDPTDQYKTTFALAQDMGNIRLQDGVNVSVTQNFPGCKDATLANTLAWRSLRGLSFPLAKAELIVDRTFYNVVPAQVLAFTDEDLGFVKLPVRVVKVDLGRLEQNEVRLQVVQDIYLFQTGNFGNGQDSGWDDPADNLVAYPADQQLAYEAPRKFTALDPRQQGIGERIWAGARQQSVEVEFHLRERNASGTPTGDFTTRNRVRAFMNIGTLTSALNAGDPIPRTTDIEIAPISGESQSTIEGLFNDNPDLSDQGKNLINLIQIGDEYMFVRSASNSGPSNVNLAGVYRGALDSVQVDHANGAKVYLIFAGGGLSDNIIGTPNNVDVKLIPVSRSDELDEASAATIQFTMADRFRRPYPPAALFLEDTIFKTTTTLEGNGSGGEDYGIDLDLRRRDFRSGEAAADDIAALTNDAATLFGDYPTANSSEHDVQVWNDPDGTPTLLFTDSAITTVGHTPLRIKILKELDGVLPTRMRLVIVGRHTVSSTVLTSRDNLSWDFDVTTALTGQFNFGALDTNDISNIYTADAAGQHDFTLTTSFTAGDVEYRLNSGTWTQLIPAGNTTGNIAGVAVDDTIEIRHLSSDSSALKQIDMTAPGAGTDAYGILFT